MAPKNTTPESKPAAKKAAATKTATPKKAAPKTVDATNATSVKKAARVKKTVTHPNVDSYAIIQTGGKQYQAIPGVTLAVEKLDGEAGSSVVFDEVLFVKRAEGQYEIGDPVVKGFKLNATIVKQDRGPKVVIFKMRRRKKYRVKTGHRQPFTVVRFESF